MARDEAYYEAEKRIEEALNSELQELSFAGMYLSELPETIGQLTQLTRLDISYNNIESLPSSMNQLTKLQALILTDNQLAYLPDWLRQLTQLEILAAETNQLLTLPSSLGDLTHLRRLALDENRITALPETLEQLTHLKILSLTNNRFTAIPPVIKSLTQIEELYLSKNPLAVLPEWIGQLKNLRSLDLAGTELKTLPWSFGNLVDLQRLDLSDNVLRTLPWSFGNLINLQRLNLSNAGLKDIPDTLLAFKYFDDVVYRNPSITSNPLNPELAEAYKQGLKSVKAYLRVKADSIILNETKLILVGEGAVGKTCLLDALLDKVWQEHPSTHGIEIQQVKILDTQSDKEITFNCWDFGGQPVYRPTHQLFFSAPAIYLVVWKPREGPQQGFVKEWIQLIKRREPSAKIIVVATHGGPQQRQPDIDRQDLWDIFGKDSIVDFFWVDNKPDENGNRKGITALKLAIVHAAATMPEVGLPVPKSFQSVRQTLHARGVPYLSLDEVLSICRMQEMDEEVARLFLTISHRLGHLTHYQNDPVLRDIVILRPDWLATAMSYVLDDEQTRKAHGLVKLSHLSQLWNNPTRAVNARYPEDLHSIFLRLMERFDLSYRVSDPASKNNSDPLSLIGQLVPDLRPQNIGSVWPPTPLFGDLQHTQICRIVDKQTGHTAAAEGLFYQLIVRLHKYSLGRVNYNDSIHWRRGLILDDGYNGRAFLEHRGNDIHIAVRAAYPQGFLASFWCKRHLLNINN